MDFSDDELPELISVPKVKPPKVDSPTAEATTNTTSIPTKNVQVSDENVAVVDATDDQQVPDQTASNTSDFSGEASTAAEGANGEVQVGIDAPAKKKKKKKKKKKNIVNEEEGEAIAGDIDFHDIGPVDENAGNLYDSSRPITHRIEIAVQNYKKNRKFTAVRNQVFTSYMRFGGVSTGPKQFLGQNDSNDFDMDAQEIAARRATEYIDEDEIEGLEVDFTYTATVYLSSHIIDKSGYVKIDQFREAPEVVISFINYLLNHKVCPEHEEDMKRALEVAKRAKIELPKCKFLAQSAPGKFNKACSLLFGGEFFGMLDNCWGGHDQAAKMIGISMAEASDIFEQVTGLKPNEVSQEKMASKIAITMDIIGKEPPPESQPLGTMSVSIESPDVITQNGAGQIPTRESQSFAKLILRERDNNEASPITVLLSQDEAQHAMEGMIITADFRKLSNGIWYWDRVTNVYPSYYKEAEDDSDDEE